MKRFFKFQVMRKTILSLGFLILFIPFGYAQKNFNLTLHHYLGSQPFALNLASQNNIPEDFSITRLDYYISSIKILHDGGQITNYDSVILVQSGSSQSTYSIGTFSNINTVEGIKFSIGVPQHLNHLDPNSYPVGHPLGPISPAMNWGWAAGYRFIALEGNAGSSLQTGYQFHALGDSNYFEQTHTCGASDDGNNNYSIHLDADYNEALYNLSVVNGPNIHSETAPECLLLIDNFKNRVFSPTAPSKIQDVDKLNPYMIYPNPSTGILYIKNHQNIDQIRFMDFRGAIQRVSGDLKHLDCSHLAKGVYILQIEDINHQIFQEKIILQ